ncbi:hypothetical protein [Streptomyces sp. NRRL F-5123]|uniref:hypothetical protein n=1 Tax=Streptomyces sp. NRRL F-5123 TaxID=1463856 RepID=UPI0004E2110E|nr:hypothetical protein [Streptomyces sp. NRRL F-5123]
MLIVGPVLETPEAACFSPWPVADLAPYTFAPLSGRMTADEVGSALAMLADYNARAGDGDHPSDAEGLIRGLLEAEKILAPGGLRLHDTATGTTVVPGCCCGLEDWREWLDVADGESLWLGHDPSPRFEHRGDAVRLWPDGRDAVEAPATQPVEIRLTALPAILRATQQDLRAFLSLTREWAAPRFPTLTEALVAALDEGLTVSAPLPGG